MKIKSILALLILAVFTQVCMQAPVKENLIINQIVHKIKDHQSAHFKLVKTHYSSDGIDTITNDFEVWLIRNKKDSVRHGFAWVNDNYRPYYMVFSQDSLYLSVPPKQVSVVYTGNNGACIADNDWIDYFLNPDLLIEQTQDSNNIVTYTPVKHKNKECTELKITFPQDKEGNWSAISYLIDKTTLEPISATMEAVTKERTKYNRLDFSDFDYDNENLSELRAKHKEILKANPITDEQNNSVVSILEKMLHEGDDCPQFKGVFYKDNSTFNIEDYLGKKVILVDIWYTHCPPCVRAIPAISKLNTQFKDQDFVAFGLNSVDNNSRSRKSLDNFLARRKISYDIILTSPQVDKKFKVNAYPSMYIIGKDGKIAHAEVGYDEDSFKTVIAKVEELLKQ